MQDKDQEPDYYAFLHEKHGKFQTSPEIINDMIRKASGAGVANIERIIKGEANEVYGVTTDDEQGLIIRISHTDEEDADSEFVANSDNFKTEKWAIDQSRALGVPAPEVIYLDNAEQNGKKLSICVELKIEGTPLNELVDHSNIDLEQILYQAGQILSKINSIQTYGFGYLNPKGEGTYKKIEDYLTERTAKKDSLIKSAQQVGLNPDIITSSLRILEETAQNYPNTESHLVHFDYSPKHLLVQNNQITGILDFENVRGADPILDIARWEFYFEKDFPLSQLIAGYANKALFDSNFERLKKVWKIYFGVGVLNYYVEDNNPNGIRFTKKQLQEDVASVLKN